MSCTSPSSGRMHHSTVVPSKPFAVEPLTARVPSRRFPGLLDTRPRIRLRRLGRHAPVLGNWRLRSAAIWIARSTRSSSIPPGRSTTNRTNCCWRTRLPGSRFGLCLMRSATGAHRVSESRARQIDRPASSLPATDGYARGHGSRSARHTPLAAIRSPTDAVSTIWPTRSGGSGFAWSPPTVPHSPHLVP